MSYSSLKYALSVAVASAAFGVGAASADTAVSVDGDQIKQVVQEQEQLRNTERKQMRTHKMAGEGYSSSAEQIRAREQKRQQLREQKQMRSQSPAFSGNKKGVGQQGGGRSMAATGGKGGKR